jgi:hypothetical protein
MGGWRPEMRECRLDSYGSLWLATRRCARGSGRHARRQNASSSSRCPGHGVDTWRDERQHNCIQDLGSEQLIGGRRAVQQVVVHHQCWRCPGQQWDERLPSGPRLAPRGVAAPRGPARCAPSELGAGGDNPAHDVAGSARHDGAQSPRSRASMSSQLLPVSGRSSLSGAVGRTASITSSAWAGQLRYREALPGRARVTYQHDRGPISIWFAESHSPICTFHVC